MHHVRHPPAANGVVVLRVYPHRVTVVAHRDGGRVVDFHDSVSRIVDVRELVLTGGAGRDEEDIPASQVVGLDAYDVSVYGRWTGSADAP